MHNQKHNISLRTLMAICGCAAIGELVLYIGPILVGVSVDGMGFAAGDAGYVVAAEFGCSAFAAVAISARKAMTHMRAIALASAMVLIACDTISFLTISQHSYIVSRIVAAVAAGALFAVGNAAAAAQPGAQRIFSMMMFVTVLFATVVYILAPACIANFGPRGPLLVLVGISAFCLLPIALLPDNFSPTDEAQSTGYSLSTNAILILLAIFVLYGSQSGLWAYVERIGQSAGIGINEIAIVLTLNGFISLGAALLANAIGLRLGFAVPIVAAMALQIVAALLLPTTSDAMFYGGAAISFTFGLIFVLPFLKALTAELDGSGRLASAATAAITLGSAAGPASIGFALNRGASFGDASRLSALGITFATAAALVALALMKHTKSRTANPA